MDRDSAEIPRKVFLLLHSIFAYAVSKNKVPIFEQQLPHQQNDMAHEGRPFILILCDNCKKI